MLFVFSHQISLYYFTISTEEIRNFFFHLFRCLVHKFLPFAEHAWLEQSVVRLWSWSKSSGDALVSCRGHASFLHFLMHLKLPDLSYRCRWYPTHVLASGMGQLSLLLTRWRICWGNQGAALAWKSGFISISESVFNDLSYYVWKGPHKIEI